MKKRRWICRRPDREMAVALMRETGISEMLAVLLLNRGISDPLQAGAFLDPASARMTSFTRLPGAVAAAELLLAIASQGGRVLVYGDYDADGITATVMAYECLLAMDIDAGYYVPHRIRDGYGLSREIIDLALKRGINLILTVDCGVSDIKAIAYAKSRGLQVIVTDHHLPGEILPAADIIVNPKVACDDINLLHLAGAGVALQVMRALFSLKQEKTLPGSSLELAALGTMADVVPLTGDNRLIVAEGLRQINSSCSAGLAALLEISGLKDAVLNDYHMAFAIAPRINAAGRMDNALWSAQLLLTDDMRKARAIAAKLEGFNAIRRSEEDAIFSDASRMAACAAANGDAVLVVAGQSWHRGVLGIVAARITEAFALPSIVISLDEGMGYGSARSVPGFDIMAALNGSSALLQRFGGHSAAAGLAVREDDLAAFRERICSVAVSLYPDGLPDLELIIDAVLQPKELSLPLVEEFNLLAPFGQGAPRPLFLASGVKVIKADVVGKSGDHLKMTICDGKARVDAIAFGRGCDACFFKPEQLYDIVYMPEINVWQSRSRLQMQVVDFDLQGEAQCDVS